MNISDLDLFNNTSNLAVIPFNEQAAITFKRHKRVGMDASRSVTHADQSQLR